MTAMIKVIKSYTLNLTEESVFERKELKTVSLKEIVFILLSHNYENLRNVLVITFWSW